MKTEEVCVTVVGAGIAGISAARKLLDHSPNINVTVLEANEQRYGGRVWSFELPGHPGKFVELGGMWIHNAHDASNVMTQFCQKYNIPVITNVTTDTNVQAFMGDSNDVFKNGHYVKDLHYVFELVDDRWHHFASPTFIYVFGTYPVCSLQREWIFAEKDNGNFCTDDSFSVPKSYCLNLGNLAGFEPDQGEHSVYDALRNPSTKLGRKFSTLSPVMQQLFVLFMEDFEAASLHEISMQFFDSDSDESDTEPEPRRSANGNVVRSGYSTVVKTLVAGTAENSRKMDVRLGERVFEISLINQSKAEVKTINSHVYHSDFVIVAVPLGVLQSDDITWHPPLEMEKKNAICRMGFGNYVKLVLIFDKQFWPLDKDFIFFLPQDNRLPRCFFLSLTNINGVSGLIGILNGPNADWADTLQDDELKSNLLEVLKVIYPHSYAEANPAVTFMKRWSWRKDPLIKGSFSFGKMGMQQSDPETICLPIKDRIFFAGEHTMYDEDMSATIAGAYLSGINAAHQIIGTLQSL